MRCWRPRWRGGGDIAATHPSHRRSAANLVHYLELRRHDVRDLQARLAAAGLSSLGRSESHVMATIESVLSVLAKLNGSEPPAHSGGVGFADGHDLLEANAKALLGSIPGPRASRIMVTLPSEAAGQPSSVAAMAASGMDIARVNCAHDDAVVWGTDDRARAPHQAQQRSPPSHRDGPRRTEAADRADAGGATCGSDRTPP